MRYSDKLFLIVAQTLLEFNSANVLSSKPIESVHRLHYW